VGNEKRVLLAVLAHPDDETFGMGGTLALYAKRGVEVHLACATRGEAGEMDEDCLDGFSSIAERREHELQCAAGILGLNEVHFLDYRDSGMPGTPDNTNPNALIMAPLEEVAAKVVHLIRKYRPQVILTFDPIGGYRHPDHIHIHQATVLAFQKAGDPNFAPDGLPPYAPQKLYYHTFPRGMLRLVVRLMPLFGKDPHKWGRNGDIDLASLAVDDFPVHASINYAVVADEKARASVCHDSQGGGGMARGPAAWLMHILSSRENYMRAYPPPTSGLKEKDLFEGV